MKISTLSKEATWILHEKYQGKANNQFNKDLGRLKAGEPIDYIIGFKEFLGCKIDLSKKPLIPRTETEFWVQKVIEEIKHRKSFAVAQDKTFTSVKVLDIFAGSGCIGVTMLNVLPNLKVTFSDYDKKFLQQIKINCRINKINPAKYRLIQSDIFKNIKGDFDYIVANPPYIPTERKINIQKSVLKYEPKKALLGGSDGLFYIRKFLAQAKNFLNPGGKIFMEFDSSQKNTIEKLLQQYKYKDFSFHKDQYGRWRYVKFQY